MSEGAREGRRKSKGLLVQDDEGNIYFLRPEILEATKVTEEERQQVEGRAGARASLPEAHVIGTLRVDAPLDPELKNQLTMARPSTVMCPW